MQSFSGPASHLPAITNRLSKVLGHGSLRCSLNTTTQSMRLNRICIDCFHLYWKFINPAISYLYKPEPLMPRHVRAAVEGANDDVLEEATGEV